jgi:CRISPR-associated endoribonuclease Cas6
MPLSVLLELEHHFPLPNQQYGRQFQGWFLDSLRKINPDLADQFHSNHHETDYTISSVFTHQFIDQHRQHGPHHSLVRFTILDDALRNFIIHQFLPNLDLEIQILWMKFKRKSFEYSDSIDKLAGYKSYARIMSDFSKKPSKNVTLNFFSPTVFRHGDVDVPLPDPIRIYRSLWRTWNAFAPKELNIGEDWLFFAENGIVINRIYQLKTERLNFAGGQRGAATGFVGRVEFALLPPKKIPTSYQYYYQYGQSVFGTLSAFSLFSGVGSRTTIGMGQTYPEIL